MGNLPLSTTPLLPTGNCHTHMLMLLKQTNMSSAERSTGVGLTYEWSAALYATADCYFKSSYKPINKAREHNCRRWRAHALALHTHPHCLVTLLLRKN